MTRRSSLVINESRASLNPDTVEDTLPDAGRPGLKSVGLFRALESDVTDNDDGIEDPDSAFNFWTTKACAHHDMAVTTSNFAQYLIDIHVKTSCISNKKTLDKYMHFVSEFRKKDAGATQSTKLRHMFETKLVLSYENRIDENRDQHIVSVGAEEDAIESIPTKSDPNDILKTHDSGAMDVFSKALAHLCR
ncbi:unnamed protein product [Didymodactylos carnosus]|uniref:Uncharacterized protein n=1 Tax=Didymodactylos carnosus TaxID=1234261 RepID=A0A814W354_9BILA|nr:unnamed protein product [Didymodactylos carnosus]CAF1196476.1 unnamed protein product [Didymodactylos carnosus]CAF3535302.1 unnamed protein product [Didymodactylos carnosus]CAF3960863.1 unnamed protein product [Didymodactylos carnosus]